MNTNPNTKEQLLAFYQLAVEGVNSLQIPDALKITLKLEMAKLERKVKASQMRRLKPLDPADWDLEFERRLLERNDISKVHEINYLLGMILTHCAHSPRALEQYNRQPWDELWDAVGA